MRKIIVLLGVLLVTIGLFTNHIFEYDRTVEASDYDIAMMHVQKVYDDSIYDYIIICDDTTGEIIHYQCYKEDKLVCDNWVYRDVAYDCLTGYYDDIHD